MNDKDLKEKIKLAKKAVEDEKDETYKTEAFKIILSKLLDSSLGFQTEEKVIPKIEENSTPQARDLEDKKNELASKCNITINELNDAISIKDGTIEIIAPVSGNDAHKHLIVAQCFLVVNEIIFGEEWTPTSKLTECLRSLGVKDLANLSTNLKNYPQLIRSQGANRNKQYRLTSGEGRMAAFNTIRGLVKGEV